MSLCGSESRASEDGSVAASVESSYRATAGVEEVPPWLTVDWVLGQFGRTRRRAQREYVQFVREGRSQKTRPWEQVQGQIYLGSKDFLQQVREQVGTETRAEIPMAQQQPGRPTLATIVGHIAQGYGQDEVEVRQRTRRPSEARQVAMYAARRIAGCDLQTIGRYFGVSYPAVSHRVRAVEAALQHNASLRKRVDNVLGNLDKVKTESPASTYQLQPNRVVILHYAVTQWRACNC